MPAPIAHASIGFLGVPALGARPEAEARWRTRAVALLVVFACGAPDLDLIVGLLLIGDPFLHHGEYSHSLVLAPAFGLLFAFGVRLFRPSVTWSRGWAVGSALYAVHVIMDALIYETRGVSLLWPVLPDRFASPLVIFVGVEYGEWWRWDLHLLTLTNEAAFGALVLWIAHELKKRHELRGAALHATG